MTGLYPKAYSPQAIMHNRSVTVTRKMSRSNSNSVGVTTYVLRKGSYVTMLSNLGNDMYISGYDTKNGKRTNGGYFSTTEGRDWYKRCLAFGMKLVKTK